MPGSGRSNRSQSKHDRRVKELAMKYEKAGHDVTADISGYSRPDTISGYRPDIVATKGMQRTIIEVETRDSVDNTRDVKQQKAFRATANRSKTTAFRRDVVD